MYGKKLSTMCIQPVFSLRSVLENPRIEWAEHVNLQCRVPGTQHIKLVERVVLHIVFCLNSWAKLNRLLWDRRGIKRIRSAIHDCCSHFCS